MEREMVKNGYALECGSECRTVRIANDVVATIAGLAATEVEGVSAIAGNITNEVIAKVSRKKIIKGVRVEIVEKVVSVNLALHLAYGYNIPATCERVQEKVQSAIETMTGLEVADVNIHIVGIDMINQK